MGVDDKTPPQELAGRRVRLHERLVNTVEVPCDPHDPNFSRWFATGSDMQPLRKQNMVTALIDGDESFVAMAAAIQTAGASDHYIYMLNWFIDTDVALDPAGGPKTGAASTKLGDLLVNASALGVQVRAMAWQGFFGQNKAAVKAINRLVNGAAILDNNTLNQRLGPFGSHHQKILIVKGKEGLIAFCGGVDFNLDRIASVKAQAGSPMHDVHCRVAGPAAFDLLKIFRERWEDHPDSAALDASKGTLRGIAEPLPPPAGEQFVQIGRTYGNGSAHPGIRSAKGKPFYTFAPKGERTAETMIFHAIEKAQKFIYVEDQYLVSMEASNKLLAQLSKIEKLVILIPHPSLIGLGHPNIWRLQKRFIDNFKADPKVVVCYLKPAGAKPDPKRVSPSTIHTYVHAKTWIMDDKFAIIGSANCGQRSYTHDSEAVAGIYDESKDTPCTLHFAHELRIRLWAEHLNMKPAAVFDPIGSAAHWFAPPLTAKVAVFDQNADKDGLMPDLENQSEPFGG